MKTSRGVVTKPAGNAHWARRGEGIVGHSKRALECLLKPFGFDWGDVERTFVRPREKTSFHLTLTQLLNKLQAVRNPENAVMA